MRLIYLFLFSLLCLATAKYLPHERVENRALLWRNQRSVSDDSDISSESEDDDVDEENDDEKRKAEEEWLKYEAKIVKEKRKYQEKVEKEQRKLQEKIEKEKRKQEESKQKLQEKLIKEELKRQEKVKKQLEKLEKETLKNQKQQGTAVESNVNNNEEKSVSLEELWKSYVYEKYGLNSVSTESEKEAAINRYVQEELALDASSTKSEQRQTIIRFIQTNLLNDTSENSLRNYLLKNLTSADKTTLETELTKRLEYLKNEATLISNVTLPLIESKKQQIEEKRTILQTFLDFLSSAVPSWIGVQSPNTSGNSGASDINQNNENIGLNAGSSDSSLIEAGSELSIQGESAVSNPSQSSDNAVPATDSASPVIGQGNDNGLTNSGISESGTISAAGSANAAFPENEASVNSGNSDPSNSLATTETGEVKPSVVTSISDSADSSSPAVEPANGSSDVASNTGDAVLNENGLTDIVDTSNNSPVEPAGADTAVQENQGANPESIGLVTKDTSNVSNGINESVSPGNEKITSSIQESSYPTVVTDLTGLDTTNSDASNIEGSPAAATISATDSNNELGASQDASNTLTSGSTYNENEVAADPIIAAPSTSDIVVSKPSEALPDVPISSNTDVTVTEIVAPTGPEDVAATLTNVSSASESSLTSSLVDDTINTGESTDVLLPSAESTVGNNDNVYISSPTSSVATDIATPSDAVESQFVSTDVLPSESPSSVKDQVNIELPSTPQNNDASLVESTGTVPVSESSGSTDTVSGVSNTENKSQDSIPVGEQQPSADAWNNEAVTDVKEIPITDVLNTDVTTTPTTNSNVSSPDNLNNSSSTAAATISDDVTIPEEVGATVVDIVPQ